MYTNIKLIPDILDNKLVLWLVALHRPILPKIANQIANAGSKKP